MSHRKCKDSCDKCKSSCSSSSSKKCRSERRLCRIKEMALSAEAVEQLRTQLVCCGEGIAVLDFLGPYSPTTAYVVNDVVLYEGSSYVAIAPSTGVTPGTRSTIWVLMAAAGTGTTLIFTGPYSPLTTYAVNDVVNFGGSSYVAILPSTNIPVTNTAYWTLLAAAGTPLTFTGPYSATTPYVVNDVVTEFGNSYVAILPSTGVPVSNTTYWALFTTAGTVFNFTGVYSPTTAYGVNDVATVGGSSYVAIAGSTGQNPTTSPAYWTLLAAAGPMGPAGTGGGIIPFSSGPISNAYVTADPPSAMGFGVLTTMASPPNSVQLGWYAIPIPFTGTISNLEASVDAHFAPNTAQVAWNYMFRVWISPGQQTINSPVMAYVPSNMLVNVPLPPTTTTTYPAPGEYVSSTALTLSGPVNVNAGDRIVMVLTSNGGTPPAIDAISFGASLTYSH